MIALEILGLFVLAIGTGISLFIINMKLSEVRREEGRDSLRTQERVREVAQADDKYIAMLKEDHEQEVNRYKDELEKLHEINRKLKEISK